MESAATSVALTATTPIPGTPHAQKRSVRQEWISRFIEESHTLAKGKIDIEITSIEADALQRVVGHRQPEDVARQHYSSYTGPDTNSGFVRVEEEFQTLAVTAGITKDGQRLSKEMLEFAYGVATLCASAADRVSGARESSAGDQIRSTFGPVPF
ncbi:hypothetical protein [Variovorax sp. V15]|uniref:hypothetical protein n=1 Tax=Variovorax sp. V15 TaxID=3065952 RepID=UPI0034E8BC8B